MAGQQVIVSQATRRGVSPASPAMASHEVKHAISPVPIESRAGKYPPREARVEESEER